MRAEYRTALLKRLAVGLTASFGRGFSARAFDTCKKTGEAMMTHGQNGCNNHLNLQRLYLLSKICYI